MTKIADKNKILYFSVSDPGTIRELNEDSLFSNEELGLWLIADGVGGYKSGEIASQIVIETVHNKITDNQNLEIAILASHQAILDAPDLGQGSKGMGSTVVALTSKNEEYEIAWVGDSRAYLWESNGTLNQLTHDHSVTQKKIDAGVISNEDARNDPERNLVTQCLGGEGITINVDSIKNNWHQGEKILLCSDGLSDELSDKQISTILESKLPNQELAENLVNAAKKEGGKDNITVIILSAPNTAKKKKSPAFKLSKQTLISISLGIGSTCILMLVLYLFQ